MLLENLVFQIDGNGSKALEFNSSISCIYFTNNTIEFRQQLTNGLSHTIVVSGNNLPFLRPFVLGNRFYNFNIGNPIASKKDVEITGIHLQQKFTEQYSVIAPIRTPLKPWFYAFETKTGCYVISSNHICAVRFSKFSNDILFQTIDDLHFVVRPIPCKSAEYHKNIEEGRLMPGDPRTLNRFSEFDDRFYLGADKNRMQCQSIILKTRDIASTSDWRLEVDLHPHAKYSQKIVPPTQQRTRIGPSLSI